jgi:ABC-2 type transport system ATP-binding protein
VIAVKNLRLAIKGKEVLKGIDLHLRPGDTYGLLGPNGAGKSTTIFALLGLRSYDSGCVNVLGDNPAHDAVGIRRSVGVMPEKAGFYDWMTAPDYLRWYRKLYLDSTRNDREVAGRLEKVGLGSEMHRPIGAYSRGMKQRLAVARALLAHPKLLILDEPTNGLDPEGRCEIHDVLMEFSADGKAVVLLCTHLLDDVDRLCNRIGIIDQGRTQLEGAIAELLAEQGSGQRYRLRLETAPNTAELPGGVTVLGHDGGWWRVQAHLKPFRAVSGLWAELWRRGWKILEIHSEASGLEGLYLNHTGQNRPATQE